MNALRHSAWNIHPNEFPTKGSHEAVIKYLLRYAILAPSVHNTQPWACRIAGSTVELYFDQRYWLVDSDPTKREAYISLGAFITNFCTAANQFGLTTEVAYLPNGQDHPNFAARITVGSFAKVAIPADLSGLQAMVERRNNRKLYTQKLLPEGLAKRLLKLEKEPGLELIFIENQEAQSKIAKLIELSTKFAFTNHSFRRELAAHIIPNTSTRTSGMPGDTANYGLLRSFTAPHVIKYSRLVGEGQARDSVNLFLSAPLSFVLCSERDDYLSWLKIGTSLERIALFLTSEGLAYNILAGPLEAPTVAAKIQKTLGTELMPQTIIGTGLVHSVAPHSPRRPVSDILIL